MSNVERGLHSRVAGLARLELSGGVDTELDGAILLDKREALGSGIVLAKVCDETTGGIRLGEERPVAKSRSELDDARVA